MSSSLLQLAELSLCSTSLPATARHEAPWLRAHASPFGCRRVQHGFQRPFVRWFSLFASMCKRFRARIPWARFAFMRHRLQVEFNFVELLGLSPIGVESSSHGVWREDTKGKVVAGYGEIC
jgi:hypothetical protein